MRRSAARRCAGAGARPCRRRACRGRRRAPPSRCAVSGLSGSSWPVTKATALADAALRDRDPGVGRRGHARGHARDDLEVGSPAARSACASSPPRPKTNGSPPFRRTTVAPGAGVLDEQPRRSRPGAPARRRRPCRRRRSRASARAWASASRRDQAVVEDDVGARDQLERRAR